MGKAEIRKLFAKIVDHYGPPEPLTLVLYADPGDECFGWWEDGRVGLNLARCKTPEEIKGTLIHEVWHACQDGDWEDEEAYEAEAAMVAKRDLHLV